MKKTVRIELYKSLHYWVVWAILIFCIVGSATLIYDSQYASEIARLPRAQYSVFVRQSARFMMLMEVLLTAYLCTADFAVKTVQNILSIGVGRKQFFISKLIMLALSTVFLYAVSWISYGIAYSIQNKGRAIVITKGELAIIFLVAILQIGSYCAVKNLVGVFCRNQSVNMIAGFGWMVMEILLGATLDLFGVEISAMDMLPLMVLQRSTDYVVSGLIYDSSFWISGIYAVVSIIIASTIGYIWFCRTDVC